MEEKRLIVPSPAIVVEHQAGGGPGYLRMLFQERGIPVKVVQAHKQDIPEEVAARFLILMGYDYPVQQMPWYEEELAVIKAHLQSRKPVMGVCAGGELITLALGGKVKHLKHRQYGWTPVQAPIGLAWVFEWHEDYFETPPGASLFVRGGPEDLCQAYIGPGYLGTQFHPEMTAEIVDSWTNRDPNVSVTRNEENREKLRSSQQLARELVDRVVAMETDDWVRG
ncbi:MAG TPA: gamma-glutamyl-gamma-aminobutyrate hydrolase family protein [Methanomassiliicoccales archaeon]|nr:gamma-glutamyl-gamma-aminobutyrate hydrolase family protein [Methanomassiliicoccales archaeon]